MPAKVACKPDTIHAELARRIATGRWKIDERIPTEVELAAEFGCSRTTVSKAISRLTHDGFLERRTRAGTRVLRTSPPSARTPLELNACAFIYPNERHEGIWRTVSGFQQAAAQAERRSLLLSTGSDFRQEAEIVGRLSEFDVRGAILFPVVQNTRDYGYYSQMILACRFPIVLVELNMPGVRRPAVVPDGLHAGYTMTKHLIAQGLKRIGFVSNYSWAPLARDKYLGYRQAMDEAGLGGDGSEVHLDPEMNPSFENPLLEPRRVAAGFLKECRNLEGLVCSSDFLALGAIDAAAELGMRVPEDLKIAGIDDFGVASSGKTGLTTYHIPYEEIGRRAFLLLQEILAGTDHAREVQVRGHIVLRQSA